MFLYSHVSRAVFSKLGRRAVEPNPCSHGGYMLVGASATCPGITGGHPLYPPPGTLGPGLCKPHFCLASGPCLGSAETLGRRPGSLGNGRDLLLPVYLHFLWASPSSVVPLQQQGPLVSTAESCSYFAGGYRTSFFASRLETPVGRAPHQRSGNQLCRTLLWAQSHQPSISSMGSLFEASKLQ